MALPFILNQDEEENQQGNDQNSPLGSPTGQAGEQEQATAPVNVGGAQGGGTVNTDQGQAPKGTSSGRFTNIQNYLKANQGANTAGKITGKIQGVADTANQNLAKAQNEFQTQSNAAKPLSYDESVFNNLKTASNVASAQPDLDRAKSQLQTAYQGPTGLGAQEQLTNEKQNLQSLGQSVNSEAGRFGLLKQFFNRPTYSGGQQKLDNLLLQGNKNQLKTLQDTRQIGGQFDQALTNAQSQAATTGQGLLDQAADTRSKAGQALDTAQGSIFGDLQSRVNEWNAREASRTGADLTGGNFNGQDFRINNELRNMASPFMIDDSTLLKKGGRYTKSLANEGNIDPAKAALLNQLYGLTPDQSKAPLAVGPQVQEGKYSLDEGALRGLLSPEYTKIQSLNNQIAQTTAPGSTTGNDWGDLQNAKMDVINNFRKKLGLNAINFYGPEMYANQSTPATGWNDGLGVNVLY